MEESNPNRWWKHLARWDRWRKKNTGHLRKPAGWQRQSVSGEFLRGAAYKLGSGAVTLLILWWETRH